MKVAIWLYLKLSSTSKPLYLKPSSTFQPLYIKSLRLPKEHLFFFKDFSEFLGVKNGPKARFEPTRGGAGQVPSPVLILANV